MGGCVCVSEWVPFSFVADQLSLLWTHPFVDFFLFQFACHFQPIFLLFGPDCNYKNFSYAPLCM